MRSLLLASAAALLSAGFACAQTANTSSPAPTGSPAHATVPVKPGMSPGNEGTSGPAAGSSMAPMTKTNTPTATPLSSSGSSGTTHTPPAQATSSETPNMMPAPGGSTATPEYTKPMMHHHHHGHMMKAMSMPMSTSAPAYLGAAKDAIMHHNKMAADESLSMAETRLLNRSVPASGGAMADTSPAVSSIEDARKAVASGDNATALKDIGMAQSAAQ